MKAHSLKELFIEELRDLYDAENQLTKALPKMAEGSSSPELREAFEEHLEQTRNHVSRLEKVFAGLGEKPKAEKCKGMEGLIKEGSELLKEDDFDSEVKDAAIIGPPLGEDSIFRVAAAYEAARGWRTSIPPLA